MVSTLDRPWHWPWECKRTGLTIIHLVCSEASKETPGWDADALRRELGRGRLGSSFCDKNGSVPRQPGTDTRGPSHYSGPERSGPCVAVAVLG